MDRYLEFLRSKEADYWSLLEEIVNIESPSSHKQGVDKVGDVLAARWHQLGFEETRIQETEFGDHRIFNRCGSNGMQRYLLVGHMDTVFDLDTGWPFRKGDDGRTYGPGVVDMKGGLVSMVAAVEVLDLMLEGKAKPSLRVLLNSDEEPGSPRSRELLPQVVDECDAGFVLEPAEPSGKIVTERKGVGIFTLQFKGRSAHAGQEPELGLDANEALARALIESKRLAAEGTGTTVNPGVITGGSVPYAIAERSVLHLDVRVSSNEEMKRVQRELEELAQRPFVPGVVAKLSGGFHRPPMVRLPGAEAIIEAYAAACEEVGMAVSLGISGAASDANSLVAVGLPCLDGLGPVGGRAHSREEYFESETFVPRTIVLAATIARLSQTLINHSRSKGGD